MTRHVHGHKPWGVNFPRLTTLIAINLSGNPGFESFRPVADAGPGGTLSAGQTVTLGGPGTSGGPWGSNLIYRWGQQDASDNSVSTVALSSTEVAKPTFVAPALAAETVVNLELRVSGKGDANLLLEATSTANFTIRALAPTALAVVSKPVSGDTYKLGETVAAAVTFGDRVLVDTSLGTPELALTVGTATRRAAYVRGGAWAGTTSRHDVSPRTSGARNGLRPSGTPTAGCARRSAAGSRRPRRSPTGAGATSCPAPYPRNDRNRTRCARPSEPPRAGPPANGETRRTAPRRPDNVSGTRRDGLPLGALGDERGPRLNRNPLPLR